MKPWTRLYYWAAERLYHEFAWAYDAVSWLVSLGRWTEWRRFVLPHVRGPRVLELGFGTGDLLGELAGRYLFVCGVDLSPAMHRVAAHKLRRRGIVAPRLCADTRALPFAAASFDTLVSTFPSGYILAPETLREAARVLRPPGSAAGAPGGRLVIVGLPLRVLRTGRGAGNEAGDDHRPQLVELAGVAGFTIELQPAQAHSLPIIILERRADHESSEWNETHE